MFGTFKKKKEMVVWLPNNMEKKNKLLIEQSLWFVIKYIYYFFFPLSPFGYKKVNIKK